MPEHIEFPSRSFWERFQQTQPTHGDILQSMEEGPLHLDVATRGPTYRLLLIPSLIQPPSVTRVFRRTIHDHREWVVVGKVTDGPGGLSIGRLVWELTRVLHVAEAARLERLIDRLQFLSAPVTTRGRGMLDGVSWVLEGVQNQTYHVIYRHSPDEEPLREFGDYLAELSRVDEYERDPEALREQREAHERESRRRRLSEARAIVRSNRRLRPLVDRLEKDGLTCPHCDRHSREVRFIDKSPKAKSYFQCKLCGRTFGSE